MAKSNSNTKLEFSVVASMMAVTLISGAMLSSMRVNADTDSVDEINITVPTACTMSGNIAAGQEHTASINPNTYQNNIGKTTITAYCNDSGGYAIYAIGYTGDEYTGEDHTKLIGANTDQKIATGIAKTGTSQWAMRVTPVIGDYAPTIENDFDSADYHVIPDTYEKVAIYGNTTDAEGRTGSSIETTYAAYISGTQSADTYVGKVKYTLVHPATEVPAQPQATQTGKICYYANASDAVGTMGCQTIPTSGGSAETISPTSATLLASNFSRTGYGFAGWSDKFDYTTNPEAKFYGPQETISYISGQYSGTNPGLSLYAVWVKSQGNLQDSSKAASVCNSLTTAPTDGTADLSSVSALTDQRDNNTYAIAKLADGKCWMIENMRLDDTPELSFTNTNNPSLPLTNNYAESTTSNHLSPSISPTTTAWCMFDVERCDDQSMLNTDNLTNRAINPTSNSNTNIYSYGGCYNWYSATAGHGKYGDDYASGYTAPGDICPTGWTMPTSGSASTDFGFLSVSFGGTGSSQSYVTALSNAFRSYPNNFLYSRSVSGASINSGVAGSYWSKSALNSSRAYGLQFRNDYVYPSHHTLNKYYGITVRCLAQNQ